MIGDMERLMSAIQLRDLSALQEIERVTDNPVVREIASFYVTILEQRADIADGEGNNEDYYRQRIEGILLRIGRIKNWDTYADIPQAECVATLREAVRRSRGHM